MLHFRLHFIRDMPKLELLYGFLLEIYFSFNNERILKIR